MMFTTSELIKAQGIKALHQVEITLELQHGVFTNGVVGCKEGTKFKSIHR